jgi:hypothetical protein
VNLPIIPFATESCGEALPDSSTLLQRQSPFLADFVAKRF